MFLITSRSLVVYICALHLLIYKVIVFVADEWQSKKAGGYMGFFFYVCGWVGGMGWGV